MEVKKYISFLLVASVVLIGLSSGIVVDDVLWDVSKTWVVANGQDSCNVRLQLVNSSLNQTLDGYNVQLSVNNSVFGSLSPTDIVTANGQGSTVFQTKTKSGTATIKATVYFKVNDTDPNEPLQSKTWTKEILIDHDTPYRRISYSVPSQMTVGNTTSLRLAYIDKWGNPIDNRNVAENVYFQIGYSPNSTARFIGASPPGNAISVPVDATGNVTVGFQASINPGTNIIIAHPEFLDQQDDYFYIEAVANGIPVAIEQSFDPEGYLGNPPKQYADGISLFQIVYTLRDVYGNGVVNSPIAISTNIPGEESIVYTNAKGQAMLTYGPKTTIGKITITAASQINPSVTCSKEVMFISQEAVDMQFTAVPDTMPSRDVDADSHSELRAKVIDENGNPVEGELVTFSMGVPQYLENYTITMQPELSATSALTNSEGFAIVNLLPGAFTTNWADPNFDPTATGKVMVTAHWENQTRNLSATHSLEISWKNYPYLSLETSVYPQTVNVTDTVDVMIKLVGDGWALQPNPIDVVLCTDRSGSMLYNTSDGILDDRMVHAMNAGKIFNSQMSPVRDRVGLVSFGDNTATGGWANLTPTKYYSTYYKRWRWAFTTDYGVYSGWFWVSNDNNYECDYCGSSYCDNYDINSIHQQYVNKYYPGSGKFYGTSQFASIDLNMTFDRSTVNNTINMMVPAGGTPMREGLYRSVKMIRDNPRPKAIKAIVLLSDGAWNTGGNPEGGSGADSFPEIGTGSVIDWANTSGIKLFTVALGNESWQTLHPQLQSYATKTGGKFYWAKDATSLTGIYTDIAGELKTEAGVNTQIDLNFENIEVNYQVVAMNSTYKVLDYVPNNPNSTRILHYNETATLLDTWVNQSDQWNDPIQPYHLKFNPGTIKLKQVWEARYTLRVLADGNINIFGPGSTISFNNGESILYLPKTYVTGVPGMVTSGVNTSVLNLTNVTPGSDTDPSTGGEYLKWTWDRYYTGRYNVTEEYYLSFDGGMQWKFMGSDVLTPAEISANPTGEFKILKNRLPPVNILFKVVANAEDAPGPVVPPLPPPIMPATQISGENLIHLK